MFLICECGFMKIFFVCILFVSNFMNNWYLICCFYFCFFSENLSFYYFFNLIFKLFIYFLIFLIIKKIYNGSIFYLNCLCGLVKLI